MKSNMKKFLSFLGAAVICASCVFPTDGLKGIKVNNGKTITCNGPVVTRTLDFSGFDAITVNGSSDMEILQGDVFQVLVKANEEVFDHIAYKVEDAVLIIENKDSVNIKAEEYDVTVTLPILKALTVNGAADVEMEKGYVSSEDLVMEVNGAGDFSLSGIKVPSLSVELNGAGDIEANGLDVKDLSVEVNGAGDIDVSGKAVNANFSVSGVADIDARELVTENVKTSKEGLGRIRLKR